MTFWIRQNFRTRKQISGFQVHKLQLYLDLDFSKRKDVLDLICLPGRTRKIPAGVARLEERIAQTQLFRAKRK